MTSPEKVDIIVVSICMIHHKDLRILFVIKERMVYGTKSACYGLVNSCEFVANELREHGIKAEVTQVVDNNCIDKAVATYKPTHCFIEALWVVPEKFKVLAKLHPKVKWVVRIHSMIPFLVSEGMSFGWMAEYMELKKSGVNIDLSCNNAKLHDDLSSIFGSVSYTPNIYRPKNHCILEDIGHLVQEAKEEVSEIFHDLGELLHICHHEKIINIGCFGALRVLKNHAQQALWAIQFSRSIKKKLFFHVNVSSHEGNETSPVLKNLRQIFKAAGSNLVEHTWMTHEDFLELVEKMDLGMQISFTETFNIVAADFVIKKVPIVASHEVSFLHPMVKVTGSDPQEVYKAMSVAMNPAYRRKITSENLEALRSHNKMATEEWLKYLKC